MTDAGGRSGPRGLFDWTSVATGAALALAVAVPVIVVSSVIGIDDESNTVFAVFFLYLVGQTLGGWMAARRQPAAPLSNGAMASITAYVLVIGVASIIRITRGESLDWDSLILNAFLAASAGLLGGVIATWKRPPTTDSPPDTGRPGVRPG